MDTRMWAYARSSGHAAGTDLTGFKVEATDGHIGRIDRHSADAGRSYIVVDTGPWIFGRHVVVPAGLVKAVDVAEETVHVAATKDEIKASPDFESGRDEDEVAFIRLVEEHYTKSHM
ncbi:PRC-barrel domain-containing protein [Streptomyces sp. WAC06614]|uniref:PRC-barrel domain-containing protein n=1 Tax=Streptomyces sp. WAC06614 TaxID=2487416 RepID=UPI000F7B506B|nr:PRC-barrel domain-containing protein [Streptomyces sp. WAC06614]RSS72837.1 PRC-barrel domain containing protein [Streptomyces sp. WAC06614]